MVLRRFLRFLALVLATVLLAAGAARAANPEPGIWLITEEYTGRPGRGFQVDFQGATVVLTYYGYEANGDATYYLGAGPLKGDTVTLELLKYAGGPVLAGAKQDARQVQSMGNATLTFATRTTGTIQLPGETKKAIFRGTFGADTTARFGGVFQGAAFNGAREDSYFELVLNAGKFSLTRNAGAGGTCRYTGTYSPTGSTFSSSGTYSCGGPTFASGRYAATDLSVNEANVYTGAFMLTPANGGAVVREMHVAGKSGTALTGASTILLFSNDTGSPVRQPWPYPSTTTVNRSVACILPCTGTFEVGNFSLQAGSVPLTVVALKTTKFTDTSPSIPTFEGILDGMTIPAGVQVTFRLLATYTQAVTTSLRYTFTIAETGETFTQNVTFTTN